MYSSPGRGATKELEKHMDKKTVLRNLRTARKLVALKLGKKTRLSWKFILDKYTFTERELDEILESDLDYTEKMNLLAERSCVLLAEVTEKAFEENKNAVNKIMCHVFKDLPCTKFFDDKAFMGNVHSFHFPNPLIPHDCGTCKFQWCNKKTDAYCSNCQKNKFISNGVNDCWLASCEYMTSAGLE